ncbi:MAG: HIRAN domain-containing protein [Bacillota bacterium]|nr:HIRAN domain-containing protein [Bacillota bacterium]
MKYEIDKKKTDLVETIKDKSVGDLIKPLTNEIHLFDTYIAGTSHIEDQSVFDKLKINDKLILKREDNVFDSKAILVLNEDKVKLGYIPEVDNIIFSRLMDAGKLLIAKVKTIKKLGNYYKISIGIYMVDF